MTPQQVAQRFLDWLKVLCVLACMLFTALVLVSFEIKQIGFFAGLSVWARNAAWCGGAFLNLFFLDILFFAWARLRMDMYVISHVLRRQGGKFERGIHVRLDHQDYFVPPGQELVIRHTPTGNAQAHTGPETKVQAG